MPIPRCPGSSVPASVRPAVSRWGRDGVRRVPLTRAWLGRGATRPACASTACGAATRSRPPSRSPAPRPRTSLYTVPSRSPWDPEGDQRSDPPAGSGWAKPSLARSGCPAFASLYPADVSEPAVFIGRAEAHRRQGALVLGPGAGEPRPAQCEDQRQVGEDKVRVGDEHRNPPGPRIAAVERVD